MMNCEKINGLLPEFVAGELPEETATMIDLHLADCPQCRQEFETELDLMVNLSGLPVVKCPDHVTAGILEEIENDEKKTQVPDRFWMLKTSTLVAAALALFLLMPGTRPTPSADQYSQVEISAATEQARYALAKVATVINRNENDAFEHVFSREIRGAVGESLLHITRNLQGEV